jgi:hypothetical protein
MNRSPCRTGHLLAIGKFLSRTILAFLFSFGCVVSTRAQTYGGVDGQIIIGPPPPIQIGPVIYVQPRHTSAVLGGTATFAVEAGSPSGSLNYQWFHDSTALPDATNDVLMVTNVTAEKLGNYTVEVRENSLYPVLSQPAVLLLAELADISIFPAMRIVASAEPGKFLQLEYSNDLQSWSDDGSPLQAISEMQSFTRLAAEGGPGFFRVKVTDVFPGGPANLDGRSFTFQSEDRVLRIAQFTPGTNRFRLTTLNTYILSEQGRYYLRANATNINSFTAVLITDLDGGTSYDVYSLSFQSSTNGGVDLTSVRRQLAPFKEVSATSAPASLANRDLELQVDWGSSRGKFSVHLAEDNTYTGSYLNAPLAGIYSYSVEFNNPSLGMLTLHSSTTTDIDSYWLIFTSPTTAILSGLQNQTAKVEGTAVIK